MDLPDTPRAIWSQRPGGRTLSPQACLRLPLVAGFFGGRIRPRPGYLRLSRLQPIVIARFRLVGEQGNRENVRRGHLGDVPRVMSLSSLGISLSPASGRWSDDSLTTGDNHTRCSMATTTGCKWRLAG